MPKKTTLNLTKIFGDWLNEYNFFFERLWYSYSRTIVTRDENGRPSSIYVTGPFWLLLLCEPPPTITNQEYEEDEEDLDD